MKKIKHIFCIIVIIISSSNVLVIVMRFYTLLDATKIDFY